MNKDKILPIVSGFVLLNKIQILFILAYVFMYIDSKSSRRGSL